MIINYILILCFISLINGLNKNGLNRLDTYHKLGECVDLKCSKENNALINIIRIIEKNDYKFNHKLNSCKNCMIKFYEKLNAEEKCKFGIGRESNNLKYDKLSFEEKREFMSKKFRLLTNDEKLVLKNCLIKNECQMEMNFYKKYMHRNEFKQLIKCLNEKCLNEFKIALITNQLKKINSNQSIEITTKSSLINNTFFLSTKSDLITDITSNLTTNHISDKTNTKNLFNTTKPLNLIDGTTKLTYSFDATTKSVNSFNATTKSTNLIDITTKSTNLIDGTTKLTNSFDATTKSVNSFNATTKSTNLIDITTKSTNLIDITAKSTNSFNAINKSTNLVDATTKSVNLINTTAKSTNSFDAITKSTNLFNTTKSINLVDATTKSINLIETTTKSINLIETTAKSTNSFDAITKSTNPNQTVKY